MHCLPSMKRLDNPLLKEGNTTSAAAMVTAFPNLGEREVKESPTPLPWWRPKISTIRTDLPSAL